MDGNRFDELTRTLATGASRRRVLRGILGGAAGGLLAQLGVRGGAAQECRGPGRLCNKNANCCSNRCDTTNPDPFKRKRCLCPDGSVPVNFVCANPCADKQNGTPCDDGNLCTRTDTCQNGQCVGGNPVVCTALDQCHVAGVCNPANGVCSNPPKANTSRCDDGNPCTTDDVCTNGVCAGTPITCGQCLHCVGGQCVANPTLNGTPCNDGNACTTNDVCTNGVCAGTPIACGQCVHCVGGACVPDAAQNGASCDDGNACTTGDVCNNGVCGGTPVSCGQCQHCVGGTCVPDTGQNGSACNDGDACTIDDVCTNGTCAGTPVVCGQCLHCVGGSCVADAGQNGSACDDGLFCTTGETCQDGVCSGGTPTCPAADCLTCDEANDMCVETCTAGQTCSNGTCVSTCPNDRPLLCPGMNGHQDKCCPTDSVCDYSPSGAVNCRNI